MKKSIQVVPTSDQLGAHGKKLPTRPIQVKKSWADMSNLNAPTLRAPAGSAFVLAEAYH